MASLEKKQVVVEKMIGKLSGAKDENAKKYFGCVIHLDVCVVSTPDMCTETVPKTVPCHDVLFPGCTISCRPSRKRWTKAMNALGATSPS